ncbi:restriction endonuclease subunit S [Marinifilum sp.]|uniref:restriction endonuclease subunit S n=1 Tax=Marinifilum sp. TaxID=2033137 RepID=UPI003BA8A7F9
MSKKGWTTVSLGDIASWSSGGTPKSTNSKFYNGDIPWIVIGDLNDSYVENSKKSITEEGLENSSAKLVKPGSLLIGMYGSIGKLGIAKKKLTTNQAIAFTQRIYGNIPVKFLFYFILYKREYLLSIGKGGAQQNISQAVLKNVKISLPPLNEQKRIANKLDQAFLHIDSLQNRLNTIPELLKQFRKMILQKAVSGELTSNWRKANTRTASTYLKELQELKLIKAKNKKQIEDINSSFNISIRKPFDINETWDFVKLDCLVNKLSYGTSAKSNESGEVPVLRMGNIQNGSIDWGNLKYSSNDSEINKYLLKKGDLLFNRTNSAELVGKTAIYRGERKAIYAGYLIRIDVVPNVSSEYLNFVLNSSYGREWCELVKTNTAGQSNINAQKLSNFMVPIPHIDEQQEIVKHVSELFRFADQVESKFNKTKHQLDTLPQQLLIKAFRGELVAQDPNDESAEKLLEQIKQEIENLKRTKKKSK